MNTLDALKPHHPHATRTAGTHPRLLRTVGAVLAVATAVAFGITAATPAFAAPHGTTIVHSSTSDIGVTARPTGEEDRATSTTTLVTDARAQWIAAVRDPGTQQAFPDLSGSLRQVGFNSHGPWINLSYTAQKVILAAGGAYATISVCRIPEIGWALCALSAVVFAGVFELLKAHRICPSDKPVFKLYLSNHTSYCE
ncbi:hypothetical protein [Curtobacterium sp. VKM Ac-2852]|uniref:hypothetical protein n=1 Tax=Curtobacterium sp. VKM Ac-2852 TaxID=2739024 RepID=UPI001565E0A5|nr:hypothetical protein [Curtobacterium sp. VKM Ac-2852]NQX24236.1 hypothetical protein [Curtobacterium sp. VKM Ac-2852]